jgi:NADH:ubiquinone oxidoreductase subunit E
MTIQKILLDFEPQKKNLLPLLNRVSTCFGFISKEQLYLIADYFGMAPAKVFSVITASEVLKYEKPKFLEVKICMGPHCRIKGAKRVLEEAQKVIGVRADKKSAGKFDLQTTSCIGHCLSGPVVKINGTVFNGVRSFEVDDLLKNYL